jgi:Arc/MetJ family transcription regulator
MADVAQGIPSVPEARVPNVAVVHPNTAATSDPPEHARVLIGRKVRSLFPGLDCTTQADISDRVVSALRHVVRSEIQRVLHDTVEIVEEYPEETRRIVANSIDGLDDKMSDLVTRLSALLSARDLIGLLGSASGWEHGLAGLCAHVPGSMADPENGCALTSLLANEAASIRESVLDTLAVPGVVDAGSARSESPRPQLSQRTGRVLSDFVVSRILERLARTSALSLPLRQTLRHRLDASLTPDAILMLRTPDIREAVDHARRLQAENRLTEDALLAAVQKGESRMATAILAVASGLPVSAVDWATTLRSAKGLVSLVWKAGFSMRVAVPLQTLLARLSPASVLRPAPGNGFPLSVEEMRWQIEFLENMGR